MRLSFLLSAAALALAASAPASATVFLFGTNLSSAGEPVPTSPATGTASVSFDDASLNVSVTETFANLVTPASASHIHCCTAVAGTGSAGVSLGLAGFPSTNSDTYTNTFLLTQAAFDTLLAGVQAGKAYVNIHSPGTYAAGEIRGFLAPVPEPSSYALLLGGLGLVAWAARRRPQA